MPFIRDRPEGKDNNVIFDPKTGNLFLFCRIDSTAVLEVRTLVGELKNQRRKRTILNIEINSRGGEALQGLAIYDILRDSGLRIRTLATGEVSSAALAVVMAGHERWMRKNSVIGFHRTNYEFGEPQRVLESHRVDIESRQIEIIDACYAGIITNNSSISAKQLRNLEENEEFVTATKAKELGLIHKIVNVTPF